MKQLFLYIVILLSFSSCEKFLDVKPAREVTSDDLLAQIKGYESALGGLYYAMGQNNLYGADLQFGLIDVLGGYWDISATTHRYYLLNNYEYPSLLSAVTAFWNPMYRVIFNANNIINTLERKTSLTAHEKIILGEAVGVRAFLHLDLFRLYGPVVKEEGLSARAIPYRTKANAVIEPFLTAGDFLTALRTDLSRAEELLAADPILENGSVANGNVSGGVDYNSLLDRRRIRFNLNAATALLARAYQLEGNPEKAREYAQKTLDNTDASFVTPQNLNLSTTADTRLTKEIIFGLYLRNHYADTRAMFGIDGASVAPNSSLYVNYDVMQNFIYTEIGDYRRTQWFQQSLNYTVFTRYAEPPAAQDAFLAYRPEVSLISLSEMYLILAESYYKTNPGESYRYLNQLRTARGIESPLDITIASSESALREIIQEARRQYFGEGQLFYLLKRNYLDIEKSATNTIEASLPIYKLPVPTDELDFNN